MNSTRKILAPTDLSALSQAGVRVALEMAADRGAEVVLYNVLGYEETTIPSGQHLRRVDRAARQRAMERSRLAEGRHAEEAELALLLEAPGCGRDGVQHVG